MSAIVYILAALYQLSSFFHVYLSLKMKISWMNQLAKDG